MDLKKWLIPFALFAAAAVLLGVVAVLKKKNKENRE